MSEGGTSNLCLSWTSWAGMLLGPPQKEGCKGFLSDGDERLNHEAFPLNLSKDVLITVLSFLHPKDAIVFGSISRAAMTFVEHGDSSLGLWRTLWKRDFGWLVESWPVGAESLHRSDKMIPDPIASTKMTKEFYFRFGLCFGNYLLAGQNTDESSLVMIHGHIYDVTPFLNDHPGSPDTLLVHSGKDSTRHFEENGHSLIARRLAQKLCVVVNAFCHEDGCGTHPTSVTTFFDSKSDRVCNLPAVVDTERVPKLRNRLRTFRKPSTLSAVNEKFQKEGLRMQKKANRICSKLGVNILGVANIFYDPFCGKWFAWYTNNKFKTVYQNLD